MDKTTEAENREYLKKKVSHILEPLVKNILIHKPDNPHEFMIKWLHDNYGSSAASATKERLNFLKQEVARLQDLLGDDEESDRGSEHESEESDEEDYLDELPTAIVNKHKGPRSSVSAEAFGLYNKKEDFKPTVIPKSDETKDKIRERLSKAFMFSALADKEKDIVIDAMSEHRAAPGDYIIKQGDDGDNLYVVESGKLKCEKLFSGNSEPTFLKFYEPGEAFGELALLYNAPRAATIIADQDSVLWGLDRKTFNHIVKDAAAKKREKYEEFLKTVEILKNMDPYERSKLADAFKEENYENGDYIIREGDQEGNVFYFIEHGEAVATKTTEPGKPPVEVMQYKPGQYFGERSLIENEPRAANVIAKS